MERRRFGSRNRAVLSRRLSNFDVPDQGSGATAEHTAPFLQQNMAGPSSRMTIGSELPNASRVGGRLLREMSLQHDAAPRQVALQFLVRKLSHSRSLKRQS